MAIESYTMATFEGMETRESSGENVNQKIPNAPNVVEEHPTLPRLRKHGIDPHRHCTAFQGLKFIHCHKCGKEQDGKYMSEYIDAKGADAFCGYLDHLEKSHVQVYEYFI